MSTVTYLFLMTSLSFGTSFWWNIPKSNYEAAPGAAVEVAMEIGFCQPHLDSIFFSSEAPPGVQVLFQPRCIDRSQRVVMVIAVTDSTLKGTTVSLTVKASDKTSILSKEITITVPDESTFSNDAEVYRDLALQYLFQQHHVEMALYEGMGSWEWTGYRPYVHLLEVDHYVFIYENWRINVLQHIMIPPHDWEKIFISNEVEGFYWGVKIDTEEKFIEIPCTPYFYFQQDQETAIGNKPESTSAAFALVRNFPNPFNPRTTIRYSIPKNDKVEIAIYNVTGEWVRTIESGEQIAGEHKVEWDGRDASGMEVSSGVYFYRMRAGDEVSWNRMTLVK